MKILQCIQSVETVYTELFFSIRYSSACTRSFRPQLYGHRLALLWIRLSLFSLYINKCPNMSCPFFSACPYLVLEQEMIHNRLSEAKETLIPKSIYCSFKKEVKYIMWVVFWRDCRHFRYISSSNTEKYYKICGYFSMNFIKNDIFKTRLPSCFIQI